MIRAIPIIVNQTIGGAFVALICLSSPSATMAQDTAPSPPSSDYVSRAEYDKLKAEHEAMKQELDALKATVQQMTVAAAPAPAKAAPKKPISEGKQVVSVPPEAATEELRQEVETLKLQVKETFPGTTKFLLAGYGTAGFTARSGEDPFFDAAFNAIFLWKLTDRLFFEGELEFDFDNDANFGGHVAVGGHVGFIPIPQLEIGYGIQRSKVGPRDQAVTAVLQSADFNYVQDSTLFKGLINFRAQWVWSHVGNFVYDPYGSQGFGPLEFNNNRNGGYVELAYRPTHIDNDYIKNFEGVFRYDRLNQLHTPVGFDEQRWTFGLNYWLTPSTVIKAAYEVDDKNGGARDQNAFLMQAAVGF